MINRACNVVSLASALVGLLLLSACASSPLPPQANQQDLGTLIISKPLMIAAEQVSVSLQQGRVVEQVNRSLPVCRLESWKKSEQAQSINPDKFRISQRDERQGDVSQGFGFYGSNDAAVGTGIGFRLGNFSLGAGGRDGYALSGFHDARIVQSSVRFRLVSNHQPLIYQMICFSAESWVSSLEPVSESQINEALGSWGYLKLRTPL